MITSYSWEDLFRYDGDVKPRKLKYYEKVGLDGILAKILADYEKMEFGEINVFEVMSYTVASESGVEFLDGYHNQYVMGTPDGELIGVRGILLTEDNRILLECLPVDDKLEPDYDAEYIYYQVN